MLILSCPFDLFRFYKGVVDSFDAVKEKHKVSIKKPEIILLLLCCWK